MRITPLGVEGPFPSAGGACSSYLVEGGGARVLLDAGPGALARLQQLMKLEALDALALSHLHWDHISDALPLQYAVAKLAAAGLMDAPLTAFAPARPAEARACLESGAFDIRDAEDKAAYLVKGMRLTFHAVTHPVPTFAIAVEADGKRAVYSGDTTYNGLLEGFMKGADVLLLDAAELQRTRTPNAPHMTAFEAGALASQCGGRAYLTHRSPLTDAGDVLAEARLSCHGARLAHPMEPIDV